MRPLCTGSPTVDAQRLSVVEARDGDPSFDLYNRPRFGRIDAVSYWPPIDGLGSSLRSVPTKRAGSAPLLLAGWCLAGVALTLGVSQVGVVTVPLGCVMIVLLATRSRGPELLGILIGVGAVGVLIGAMSLGYRPCPSKWNAHTLCASNRGVLRRVRWIALANRRRAHDARSRIALRHAGAHVPSTPRWPYPGQ